MEIYSYGTLEDLAAYSEVRSCVREEGGHKLLAEERQALLGEYDQNFWSWPPEPAEWRLVTAALGG